MIHHKDWFSVDKKKRAARVRSCPLPFILREALANSLDANATKIEMSLFSAERKRTYREGWRAFTFVCKDNGGGCADPEILRRVGSSTSDLHPEKRGRFGQGLIDLLAVCEHAEVLSQGNRIQFDHAGCRVSKARVEPTGMMLSATLRHGGEGFDDLERYFASVILPAGVSVTFNGTDVKQRTVVREVDGLQLPTVIYDATAEKVESRVRTTKVRIYEKHEDRPMVYELGIPVDELPWEIFYDLNVLQKTPLDMERGMLPAKYKDKLISVLVNPLSDLYYRIHEPYGAGPSGNRERS